MPVPQRMLWGAVAVATVGGLLPAPVARGAASPPSGELIVSRSVYREAGSSQTSAFTAGMAAHGAPRHSAE